MWNLRVYTHVERIKLSCPHRQPPWYMLLCAFIIIIIARFTESFSARVLASIYITNNMFLIYILQQYTIMRHSLQTSIIIG